MESKCCPFKMDNLLKLYGNMELLCIPHCFSVLLFQHPWLCFCVQQHRCLAGWIISWNCFISNSSYGIDVLYVPEDVVLFLLNICRPHHYS